MGQRRTLTALIDAIIPADDYPSASQAGGEVFLDRILGAEKAAWTPRLLEVLQIVDTAAADAYARPFADLDAAQQQHLLDGLADDQVVGWFVALVNHGYYADPGNGGNNDAVSWRMLGWDPNPAPGWPDVVVPQLPAGAFVGPGGLLERYDAVVIGSGAGGGVAACRLTESGRTVLMIERGSYPPTAELAQDHLRNARTDIGFDHRTLVSSPGNPRTLLVGERTVVLEASDPRWGSNANTLGGGTRIYGAQAWRFSPEDFTMATTYGVPDGSALADWPIDYAELEPYYSQAEWEIGVSGSTAGDRALAHRSRDYPMPPMPLTAPGQLLAAGARSLGWQTLSVPLAINTKDYLGRPACARCSQCVGFACPIEAKNGSHNTVIARAAATGRLSLLLETQVERVIVDPAGRVSGVLLVGERNGRIWRSQVLAEEVVLSGGATETARLLLHSAHPGEPNGLGNNTDQVGRHLQGHVYAGALGIFDEPVNDQVGPGPVIATNDFRHHNPGIVSGGMLANEFVPTPVGTQSYLVGAGLLGRHGLKAKQELRRLLPRMQRVVGPVQEVTSAESRVRLDPAVRDRFGMPVVQLSGSHHREDERTQAFLSARAAEWLRASGAGEVVMASVRSRDAGPSSGQHQAGTARMGADPATSVTDPLGRVWGHDNLRIVDGSTHVTNGGVNPVLTIFANSFRVMDAFVGPC
ncbi:MAG: hypothetical protein QOF52_602 [Propionibacteriaceae bacterium]|nr:family oxidoreductase [Propionibacteriaceae bacterium]MDX6320744.1 hypothetical protein [Propionibacteriaceae bacterium]